MKSWYPNFLESAVLTDAYYGTVAEYLYHNALRGFR